jgi:hypothetical protein
LTITTDAPLILELRAKVFEKPEAIGSIILVELNEELSFSKHKHPHFRLIK